DISPNLVYLLLDIQHSRSADTSSLSPSSSSSPAFCIFDSLFRIGLVKQLILNEPDMMMMINDFNGLSIDFTYIIGSVYNESVALRTDVRDIIDWFISPLRLLTQSNGLAEKKCCGCDADAQVPLSIPIFCLSLIRPLPVENVMKLLADTTIILVNTLQSPTEFNAETQITTADKERIFQLLAVVQAIQKLAFKNNEHFIKQFSISPYQLSFEKLCSIAV
ncbi:unnamed protein product, partial [Schistosoma turkestanicum]